MAVSTVRYNISFRDAKGWINRQHYWITGDDTDVTFGADLLGIAQTIKTAVTALTNGAFAGDSGLSGKDSAIAPSYGSNSEYPAAWQGAVMTWTDSVGSIHRWKIGAPKIAIFDTDGVTVLNDGTQALVVAYVAALKTTSNGVFPSSRNGQPFTNFVGGVLRMGTQPKRFNEFVKSSHLVQGEGE